MSTTEQSYTVQGMTCHSCVAMVSDEVGEVAGVKSVVVDLDSGTVTVQGEDVDEDAVRRAIVEAGYETT
ncbi:MAG: heavy-metal-associated domain-containing protein [Acidimicrobiia bacterium]|nr:heavy-metal-associated domain-containing protein [Acidimicrobiia bacterium]MBA3956345.1 heavy-metal-associated domain-containing protein [Acidimicrobiia bacterium]